MMGLQSMALAGPEYPTIPLENSYRKFVPLQLLLFHGKIQKEIIAISYQPDSTRLGFNYVRVPNKNERGGDVCMRMSVFDLAGIQK
jgi:hypothetical protein